MTHEIVLKDVEKLTHDTKRYVFSRPANFDFEPGQATELTLDADGWRGEGRPFTFTSLPGDRDLEFTIKSYPDHDGVTDKLAGLTPGATAKMESPFGAIRDHGPGVFLAAGAGITPFIPILRDHARQGDMDCTLIYSNKTEADIIMRGEWEAMNGLTTVFTVTDEPGGSVHHGLIDKDFLQRHVSNFDRTFYICGPQGFVDDLRDTLLSLGAAKDKIVTEEGW